MGNKKTVPKKKSFVDQVASMFTASQKSEGNTHPKVHGGEKDDRPSIAERINWGGQYPDKKKPKGRK